MAMGSRPRVRLLLVDLEDDLGDAAQQALSRDHGAAWSVMRLTHEQLVARGITRPEPQAVLLSVGGYHPERGTERVASARRVLPRRMPLLVIHPDADASVADRALDAGAFDSYAWGPEGIPDLGRRIRRTLEHWRAHLARHMVEDAFRAGREVTQFITDNTVDMISIQTLEGDLVYVSPSAERMLGFAPDALIGQRLEDVIHPDDRAMVTRAHQAHATAVGEAVTVSYRARRADQDWLWVESISRSIPDASGAPHQVVASTRDISGRRQMQEALSASEERYRKLVETSADLMWALDAKGHWRFLNQAAMDVLGAAPESLVGQPVLELVPEDHRLAAASALVRLRSEGRWEEETIPLRHVDGSLRWLRFQGTVERQESELGMEFSGAVGSAQDVTDSIEGHRTRRFQSMLLEHMGDAVISTDRSLRVLSWNAAATRLFGWSAEEAEGQRLTQLLQTASEDEGFERLHAELADRSSWRGLLQQMTRAGEVRTIDGTVTRLQISGSGSQQEVWIWLQRDLTEQLRQDEQLRRMAAAVRDSSSGMAILGVEGDGHRIRFVNPAFCEVTGFEERDLLGAPLDILHGEMTDQGRRRAVDDALEAGRPLAERLLSVRADGEAFWNELRLSPVPGPDGGVDAVLVFIEDVSERVRAEEQRQQGAKLEALGQMAAAVSHDFNNILASVAGYAELLQERLTADDQARADAEHILSVARRGGELTRKLLAFSRERSGEKELVELDASIDGMRPLFKPLLHRGVELDVALDGQGATVMVDRVELEQLLLNLVVNAGQAIAEEGRIEVRTRRVMPDEEGLAGAPDLKGVEHLLLRVEDSGSGIPPDLLERMFEPYFTTKGDGTGLGLATVRRVVEGSEGVLHVESSVGVGTTFVLYFPVAGTTTAASVITSEPRISAPVAVRQPAGGKGLLILVEDEEVIRRREQQVLTDAGWEVMAFEAAEDLLEAIDVVDEATGAVLDLMLPGLDGGELGRQLQAEWPDLPVLHVSGLGRSEAEARGLLDPGTPLLAKPFEAAELVAAVEAALAAHAAAIAVT